jgi:hypothetical protein
MKPGGIVALLCLALAIGCGGSKEDDTSSSDEDKAGEPGEGAAKGADTAEGEGKTENEDETKPAGDEAAGDTKPVDGLVPEAKKVEVAPAVPGLDVRPLALVDIDPRVYAKSVNHNTAGYKLHAKGKLEQAKPEYIKALNIDPGNLLARYNLASILVRSGDKEQGIALLAQFKAIPNCSWCLGIIVHSRTDSEWKSVHDDAAYKAIADDVKVAKPSLKWAAKDIISAFDNGRVGENLRALLHPRRVVAMTIVKKHRTELLGETALSAWLESARESNEEDPPDMPSLIIDGFMECEKLCCTFSGNTQIGSQTSLETMCMKKGPGGALYLASLDFYNQYAEQETSAEEWNEMIEGMDMAELEAELRAADEELRRAEEAAAKDLE